MSEAHRLLVRKLGTDTHSGIAQLTLDKMEESLPLPGEREVLVRVAAASVNYPDILMTHGGYQYKPPLPYTPGIEAAGVVECVGPNVSHVQSGQRVICSGRSGLMQSYVIVPAAACLALPWSLSFVEGAALQVAYSTAYHCLIERATLQPRDSVLVNGATGGVGLAAVQIAKVVGCRTIIATGTGSQKLEIVRKHGASEVIDFAETSIKDLSRVLKELTGGKGVDVVYDPVGGEIFKQSLKGAAWGARVAVVGFVSGDNQQAVHANYMLIKGLSIFGCRAGESARRFKSRQIQLHQLLKWCVEGKIRPCVSSVFDITDAAAAFLTVANRKVVGKAVITFSVPSASLSQPSILWALPRFFQDLWQACLKESRL